MGKRRATSTSKKQSLFPLSVQDRGRGGLFMVSLARPILRLPYPLVTTEYSRAELESDLALVQVSPRKLSNSSVPMRATNRHPGRCASRLRQLWRAAGISILSGCGVGTRESRVKEEGTAPRLAPNLELMDTLISLPPLPKGSTYYRAPIKAAGGCNDSEETGQWRTRTRRSTP